MGPVGFEASEYYHESRGMDRYTEDKKNEKRRKKNTCITELKC
jgi:hypothetical protein